MGTLHGRSTIRQGVKLPQSQVHPTWAADKAKGTPLQACCLEQAKFVPCQGLRQAELENKDLGWKEEKTKAEIPSGPEPNSLQALSMALFPLLTPWSPAYSSSEEKEEDSSTLPAGVRGCANTEVRGIQKGIDRLCN